MSLNSHSGSRKRTRDYTATAPFRSFRYLFLHGYILSRSICMQVSLLVVTRLPCIDRGTPGRHPKSGENLFLFVLGNSNPPAVGGRDTQNPTQVSFTSCYPCGYIKHVT